MTSQTTTPPTPPVPAPAPAAKSATAPSSFWKWLPPLALVVVVAGGAWWWTHGPKHHAEAAAPAHGATHESSEGSAAVPKIDVVHPLKGGIVRTSSQIGSVHAFEWAELYAKVSGYLKELTVDIGDRVKQGQLLAVIDNPEIIEEAHRAEAALAQAQAAVAQAEAHIKTSKADLEAFKAEVVKSKAEIERYTSTRKFREKELNRYKGLFARNAVPQQIVDEEEEHYDSALAAEHAADAAVVSAQAKVTSAQAQVDQSEADLVEAKANVDVARSNRDKANVFVSYTKILSPYTGVVTTRGYHRGSFIRSADSGVVKPIVTVARNDKVRVVTYVPDRDVPYTDVGDKAIVTMQALPGEKFEGKVSRFAESEDTESRTMRTEIDLDNSKNRLREGMYGEATIILDPDSQALTIPTSALTGETTQGKASVFVIKGGQAHLTPIKTGADDGLRVEVLEGLSPQDAVAINPSLVTDGENAQPVEATPGTAAG